MADFLASAKGQDTQLVATASEIDHTIDGAQRKSLAHPSRAAANQSCGRKAPNRVAFFLLAGVIALAPFPYGSVDLAAIAFWCIVLGVGLVVASPSLVGRAHLFFILGIGLLVLGYGFVVHEQLSAEPFFAKPNPVWGEAAKLLGTPLVPLGSAVRNQPYYALGAPLANVLALLLGFLVGTDRDNARRLFRVFAWAGAGYAVYAICAFVLDPTTVLWREKLSHTASLTGTFWNRNTAAVFFGSCSVVWLLFLCQTVQRRLPDGSLDWRSASHAMFSHLPRSAVVAYVALSLCTVAMFMTDSRAGVLISLGALVLAFVLFFRPRLTGRNRTIAALLAATAVALAMFQIMGGGVRARLEMQGLSDSGRIETYRSALRMIADYPWFGTGLGTFAWSYPEYRSEEISVRGVWDRAHSIPLELAVELGLPLTGLIVCGWLVILIMLVRAILARRSDSVVPIAALCLALVGLVHSLIDYSLQIPGFSLPIFALIGAGVARGLSRREIGQIDKHHNAPP